MRRLKRNTTVCVVVVFAFAVSSAAPGATGPFEGADTYEWTGPDLTGASEVSTDASASRSGALRAEVNASAGPGPGVMFASGDFTTFGVSAAKGLATGMVIQEFPISPGRRTVTAGFNDVALTSSVSSNNRQAIQNVTMGNIASARWGITVHYYPCLNYCSYRRFTAGAGIYTSGMVSGLLQFDATTSGFAIVFASLSAEAEASGPDGVARSLVSGTVANMEVT